VSAREEYFAGDRAWRVLEEVTGVAEEPGGVTVTFARGQFTIVNGVFQSPLSHNRGRRGVVLQEVTPGSEGAIIAVGDAACARARAAGLVRLLSVS
jgi:hypothetical protein